MASKGRSPWPPNLHAVLLWPINRMPSSVVRPSCQSWKPFPMAPFISKFQDAKIGQTSNTNGFIRFLVRSTVQIFGAKMVRVSCNQCESGL